MLADANGLSGNERLVEGQVLVIPNKVTNIHNNAGTFRPYNPGEAIGNVNPTLPDPPPPPKKGGCGGVGMILMVVVAVVVTIYTAGAAAGLLAQGATYATAAGAAAGTVSAGAGFAATMATGAAALTGGLAASTAIGAAAVAAATVASAAIGAAVGSIASQVVGMATGNVDKFSWRAVGQSAVSAGITAGVGSALTAASGAGGVLNNTAVGRMVAAGQEGAAMLRAGIGSAVSLAAQGQWSWREVAASTVSAGAGYAAGQAVSAVMSGVDANIVRVASAAGAAAAGSWASSQVMGYNSAETRARLSQAFISGLGQGIANAFTASVQEDAAVDELARRKGFDLTQPGARDALARLYRHQQGSTLLGAEGLREDLGTVWRSTGATDEQVAGNLAVYDKAGFTADPQRAGRVIVGPVRSVEAPDEFGSAGQLAEALAQQELAATASATPLSRIGAGLGGQLRQSDTLFGMLSSTGSVLKEVAGVLEANPWMGMALEGLEIVAGPAMYAVRKGVNAIIGDELAKKTAEFNDGLVAGFAVGEGARAATASVQAASGTTFFASMALGVVGSSVAGMKLIQNLDRVASRFAGPLLDKLRGIESAVKSLQLPGVEVLSQGFTRLGTRGVAVLERTFPDGSTLRTAAVLAHGDDVAKLAHIDWDELAKIQGIANSQAAKTMSAWTPTTAQLENIEGLLKAGASGEAMRMYRMNVGTAVHGDVARQLYEAKLLNVPSAAGKGVDFPIERLSTKQPLPLELHPDTTYSFNQHVIRDYPSYLTITTPKIDMSRFFEVFGKGPW
ncbi:hypothetical protein ACQ86G_18985 [Roseateles chitinivorans]|uniref:hypothetical protein n=1 Tax=Roseateles chitinivorans TaxID=2917965 RepID=UPI003D67378A